MFLYCIARFIRAAFTLADPKSVKRYWWLNWIFTLLGFERVKAAHRMLMKLTPKVCMCDVDKAKFVIFLIQF